MSTLPAAIPIPPTSVSTPTNSVSVDLVITYSIESKTKKSKIDYEELITRIENAGLDVISRASNSPNILIILIRANSKRLIAEAKREKMADWLHGITSTKPIEFKIDSLTPAARIRHVHSILTTPNTSSTEVTSSTSTGPTAGINKKEFPNIISIFPVQDRKFNKNFLKSISTFSSITEEELDQIKDHFGEAVAFYFAFLANYFLALSLPAVVGILVWSGGFEYSGMYSMGLVLWAMGFIENWRILERKISMRWGTLGLEGLPNVRAEYVEEKSSGKESNGKKWFESFFRKVAVLPVVGLFCLGMGLLISTIYFIETVVGEVYAGPGKQILTLLPTVLFVGLVGQLTAFWHSVAIRLTIFENPKETTSFDTSLTLKLLALNLLTAYGGLLLSSYIYIPFGHILLPKILSILPVTSVSSMISTSSSYTINPARLQTQLIAYTLTGQISGAFVEMVVPFLLRYIGKVRSAKDEKSPLITTDSLEEQELLERIREEAELPDYDLFPEYIEMVIQFGYISLFSTIWPLAAVMSFINNFFEQRGDSFKLCSGSKRPIPTRASTIGPWLEALSFLAWSASITNASLVYLYSPITITIGSPVFQNLLATFSNSSIIFKNDLPYSLSTTVLNLPSSTGAVNGKGFEEIAQVLLKGLLLAVVAEKSFLLVRSFMRYVLEALWSYSVEELVGRENEMRMRRKCLEGIEVERVEVGVKEEKAGMWRIDEGAERIRERIKLD